MDKDVEVVRAVLHAHQRAMTPPDSGWGDMSYLKGSYDHLPTFQAALKAYRVISAARQQETVISDEVVDAMVLAYETSSDLRSHAMRAALSLLPRGEGSSRSQPCADGALPVLTETPCDLEGWVLVPREPTEAMMEAGRAYVAEYGRGFVGPHEVYRAMLAAAPEARSPIGASPAARQPSPRDDPNSPLPTSPEVSPDPTHGRRE